MITTSTIHDTRYNSKKRPGKYPVKLRVYDGRTGKKRLYSLTYGNFKIYLTREEWRQLQLTRIRENKLRELKRHITERSIKTQNTQKYLLILTQFIPLIIASLLPPHRGKGKRRLTGLVSGRRWWMYSFLWRVGLPDSCLVWGRWSHRLF